MRRKIWAVNVSRRQYSHFVKKVQSSDRVNQTEEDDSIIYEEFV